MNKKEIEKIRNRIAQLKLDYEKNQQTIKHHQDEILRLSQENKSIQGGIIELNLVLANLAPKEEKKKGEIKEKVG